jgi:uncharacterized protein YdhG (YjbR/CyaY superfamily)
VAGKPTTVDEYLAGVSDARYRAALQDLRGKISAAAPDAEEVISYGVPAYRQKKMLVSFGAAAKHCALYVMSETAIEACRGDLAGYDTSKGAIRFQPDQPLSAELVLKIVQTRIAENNR